MTDKTIAAGISVVAILILGLAFYISQDSNGSKEHEDNNVAGKTESNVTFLDENATPNLNNIDNNNMKNNSQVNPSNSNNTETVGRHSVLSSEELAGKRATLNTSKGTIVIEFFGEDAPKTVSNFVGLVEEEFYDGLTFHRRESGFVIQGGDPVGNGTGGPGYQFEDEVIPVDKYPRVQTDFGEVITYEKGIVAMANSGPNTNGSQFFIMLQDNQLPPAYNIFGRVVSGQEVVDQIQVGDVIESIVVE